MNFTRKRKILRQIFHVVGADKIIGSYFIFFFLISIILWKVEPNINNFIDSIWFCFATATTTGYGDISAVSTLGRILTIILSIYSIAVVAIFTAVITSYFMESAKFKAKESARKFIDDIQHLEDLSKEELKELSERVKKFSNSNH